MVAMEMHVQYQMIIMLLLGYLKMSASKYCATTSKTITVWIKKQKNISKSQTFSAKLERDIY